MDLEFGTRTLATRGNIPIAISSLQVAPAYRPNLEVQKQTIGSLFRNVLQSDPFLQSLQLTGEQVQTLENLVGVSKEGGVLTDQNRRDLYEILCFLAEEVTANPEGGVEEVIKALTTGSGGWTSFPWNISKFDDAREYRRYGIMILLQEDQGTRGVGRCGNCGGDNIRYNIMQVRRADEGSTVFFYCLDCQHRWKI